MMLSAVVGKDFQFSRDFCLQPSHLIMLNPSYCISISPLAFSSPILISLPFTIQLAMANSAIKLPLLVIFLILTVKAQVDQASFHLITTDSLEWPWTAVTMYDELGEYQEHESDGEIARRSLYRKHYYISYGALSANRILCPPRSGRSYYTNNCHKARGPANPYTRGCSAITHCRIQLARHFLMEFQHVLNLFSLRFSFILFHWIWVQIVNHRCYLCQIGVIKV